MTEREDLGRLLCEGCSLLGLVLKAGQVLQYLKYLDIVRVE